MTAAGGGALGWLRGLFALRNPYLRTRLAALAVEEETHQRLRSAFPGVRIDRDVLVQGWPEGRLELAPGSSVCKGTILCLGDPHNGHGSLQVGTGTWIGQYNNVRLGGGATIRIGSDCLVSQFCSLVAVNHEMRSGTPIKQQGSASGRMGIEIGSDVWLGAGACILPGVSIGDGAVVGAGSVVSRSIPPFEIWAGVPASRIGAR